MGGHSILAFDAYETARASLSALGVAWRAIRLLAFLYLTYGCMYLAPGARLRRWGMLTWWWLSQENGESYWDKN